MPPKEYKIQQAVSSYKRTAMPTFYQPDYSPDVLEQAAAKLNDWWLSLAAVSMAAEIATLPSEKAAKFIKPLLKRIKKEIKQIVFERLATTDTSNLSKNQLIIVLQCIALSQPDEVSSFVSSLSS